MQIVLFDERAHREALGFRPSAERLSGWMTPIDTITPQDVERVYRWAHAPHRRAIHYLRTRMAGAAFRLRILRNRVLCGLGFHAPHEHRMPDLRCRRSHTTRHTPCGSTASDFRALPLGFFWTGYQMEWGGSLMGWKARATFVRRPFVGVQTGRRFVHVSLWPHCVGMSLQWWKVA